MVKNEAALKRKLEFVEGTLGCLLDQAKRAIELDSEVLKLNEEIRLLKRSKRVSDDQIEKGTSGVNDNPPGILNRFQHIIYKVLLSSSLSLSFKMEVMKIPTPMQTQKLLPPQS